MHKHDNLRPKYDSPVVPGAGVLDGLLVGIGELAGTVEPGSAVVDGCCDPGAPVLETDCDGQNDTTMPFDPAVETTSMLAVPLINQHRHRHTACSHNRVRARLVQQRDVDGQCLRLADEPRVVCVEGVCAGRQSQYKREHVRLFEEL